MEAGLKRVEERVLTAVTAAARTRRARETTRVLWRAAPFVAAAIFVAALVIRWRNASAVIAVALVAAALLLWLVVAFAGRRGVRVSDRMAATIDDELELGGELRSAAWFAARGASDPWAGFHLDRAAERVEAIDLARVYPPVRAQRARVVTALLVAAALIVAVALPRRAHVRATTDLPVSERPVHKVLPMEVEGVPADLPQELEDLLLAIESGALPSGGVTDAALLDTLKNLQSIKDPKVLAALARAMAANQLNADDAQKMKELADRAKRDAEMTPASDVRDALDQLAKKLDDPESEMDSAGFDKSNETDPNGGVDLAGPSQTSRDATAIAGVGMIALSKQEAAESNAPPGVGVGGSSSAPGGGGTMPDIAKALRHEVIEANEDDVSGDVHSEDRRKTERGNAATAFTGATAGRSDGSRAAAPPAVPETRRARLQTYFTRKQ